VFFVVVIFTLVNPPLLIMYYLELTPKSYELIIFSYCNILELVYYIYRYIFAPKSCKGENKFGDFEKRISLWDNIIEF
jgi:hypothetical protein